MADCSAPAAETDDLHRRWLPREIFADIGIADVVDAAPPTASAAIEEAAVHLASKIASVEGPPPPPPGILSYPQPQVCGLQAVACVPYAYGAGPPPPPPCPWPLVYLPLQWQVATYGTAAFLGGPRYHYQAPPPPAKRRLGGAGVGTGVFLPRAGAGHQHVQHKAAAEAETTASPAPATGMGADGRQPEKKKKMKKKKKKKQQQQQGKEEEEEHKPQQDDEAAAEVLLALPQECDLLRSIDEDNG